MMKTRTFQKYSGASRDFSFRSSAGTRRISSLVRRAFDWVEKKLPVEGIHQYIPPIDESDETLRSYMDSAAAIVQHDEAASIANTLLYTADKVRGEGNPFVFIAASSGTGKTQMAFNLMQHVKRNNLPYRVHYLVCAGSGPNLQPIYRVFDKQSQPFLECCINDLKRFFSNKDGITVEDLVLGGSHLRLETFGYIFELVSQSLGREPSLISPKSFDEVLELTKTSTKMRPVFILDEFPALRKGKDNNIRLLQFMRNVFRALNVPVILMGTDSSAANLVTIAQNSRGISTDWCHLFHKLPKFVVPANCPKFPSWFLFLLQSSRPLFSLLAIEIINEKKCTVPDLPTPEFLNDLMDPLAREIFFAKALFRYPEGLLGQVCLFLNSSLPVPGTEIMPTAPLIHRHFGHIASPSESPFTLRLEESVLQLPNRTDWVPHSQFPPMAEDLLLYFALMGTRSVAPFYASSGAVEVNSPMTFLQAFNQVYREQTNRYRPEPSNIQQVSSDGKFYEALLAATMIIASHSNGFQRQGLSSQLFLQNIVKQLLSAELKIDDNLPGKLLDFLANLTVPYLSPPNLPFPGEVTKWSHFKFASIERTTNETGIDLRCSSLSDPPTILLSGECKNWADVVPLPEMKKIVDRIPDESKLHLVLVNSLQQSYFTAGSFHQWLASTYSKENAGRYEELAFAAIRIGEVANGKASQQAILSGVGGFPYCDCEFNRLVLFVVLDKAVNPWTNRQIGRQTSVSKE